MFRVPVSCRQPVKAWVWQTIACTFALLLLLSGCGGGGEPAPSDAGGGPVTPTATEQAQAASAEVSATLLTESTLVRLSWRDTVATASAYRVERKEANETWASLQVIPAAGGRGQTLSTDTAANRQGQYRVVAVLPATTVVLRTLSGAESLVVQTGSTKPNDTSPAFDASWLSSITIQLGPNDTTTEPVSGTVPLSLSTPAAGWTPVSVQWFVDLKALGNGGNAATGWGISWNTQGLVDGSHLVTARVEVQPDSFVEWRRTVQVKSPAVAGSMSVSGTQGVVTVAVSASSANGIASVQTSLNTTDLGTLTAPNGCSGRLCTTPNAFTYSIDTRTLPMGTYTLVATIIDTKGERLSVTRSVDFANPPTVSISSPTEGQWVHGSLSITGTSVSERAVSTQISLGSVPVATSTASAWNTSYSLAGLPAGQYVLTVRSTDAKGLVTAQQRNITVVSSASMVQSPLVTLGASSQLLAAQNGELLWRAADGTVNRRKSNGETVAMQGSAGLRYANDWQLDGGHVVAYGQADDCVAPLFVCVYAWDSTGQRRNLSTLVSGSRSYDQHPVLRFPWVMWINQSSKSTYTLQHLQPATGQTAQYTIDQPASVTGTLGNWQYDLVVKPSTTPAGNDELTAFFWGTLDTTGSPVGPKADVFRWTSANTTTQMLTASDSQQVYVQTDGQRAAWQQRAPGSVDAPYNLRVAPISGSPVTTLSTEMTRFTLRGGLLAWHEGIAGGVTGQRLMVNAGVTTETLSSDRTANLLAVAGASVVWSENGKLYAWRSATGKQLLHDVASGALVSDGVAVYLTSGQESAVYRLVLP